MCVCVERDEMGYEWRVVVSPNSDASILSADVARTRVMGFIESEKHKQYNNASVQNT